MADRIPNAPRWRGLANFVLIAGALVLFVLETISLGRTPGGDFEIFRDAAVRVMADPLSLYLSISRVELDGFLYPPPSILLFLPLGLASFQTMFALSSVLVPLCGALALALWLRLTDRAHHLAADRPATLAVLALALASGPLFAVRLGQIDTYILLVCIVPLWLDQRGWPKLAGAIIAVGCWIKIYPVLLLFWVACRPSWRSLVIGFALGAVGVPLVSLVMLPPALYLDYFATQLPAMASRVIVNIDNQSLAAIVARAGMGVELAATSFAVALIPLWFRVVASAAMFGGMALVALRARRGAVPPLRVAGWAMAAACLFAPLGWGHTYCLILPLFAEVLRLSLARGDGPRLALLGLCYALMLVPSHHRLAIDMQLPGWAAQLFYARYAVATLTIMVMSWRLGEKSTAT